MTRNFLGKLFMTGVAAVLSVTTTGCALVDSPLRRASGEYTDVVDRAEFEVQPQRVALIGANVLSPDGTRMLPNHTVIVAEGRIVSVVPSDAANSNWSSDTRVIDARGQWLIPGLIDTHVHLRHSENDLLLYVANGVTSIAEMSGEEHQLDWRRETEAGAMGPRMFIASRKLGNWGFFKGWFQEWTRRRINVGDADNAAAVVNELKRDGYDAVKVGSFMNMETYNATSEAADATGLRMLGHIPLDVGLDAVFASSQNQVAHIEELVKALNIEFGPFNSVNTRYFLDFVRQRAPELAQQLRDNNIAVSSSLWLVDSIPAQKLDVAPLLDEIALAYANPGQIEGTYLTQGWLASNNPYAVEPGTSDENRAAVHRYWTAMAEAHHILLRAMVEGGVRVTAGTDAGNAVVVPGFSLHDEMQALVDAGLSNEQSLRAATVFAGIWLDDATGCIARGCRGDLVLLNGNPLEDIANTKRIETVILGGRVLEREKLDAMLEAVKAANDSSRSVPL